MLKFNYFNADKTPFKQRLNESDERERKTSKNVLFVLENCTFRFVDYRKDSKILIKLLLILYDKSEIAFCEYSGGKINDC